MYVLIFRRVLEISQGTNFVIRNPKSSNRSHVLCVALIASKAGHVCVVISQLSEASIARLKVHSQQAFRCIQTQKNAYLSLKDSSMYHLDCPLHWLVAGLLLYLSINISIKQYKISGCSILVQ
jgi:hypothetical protein